MSKRYNSTLENQNIFHFKSSLKVLQKFFNEIYHSIADIAKYTALQTYIYIYI